MAINASKAAAIKTLVEVKIAKQTAAKKRQDKVITDAQALVDAATAKSASIQSLIDAGNAIIVDLDVIIG
jgi:hypothetical protein